VGAIPISEAIAVNVASGICVSVATEPVSSLSCAERVGVRAYGLSLRHNPSPGAAPDLSQWEG